MRSPTHADPSGCTAGTRLQRAWARGAGPFRRSTTSRRSRPGSACSRATSTGSPTVARSSGRWSTSASATTTAAGSAPGTGASACSRPPSASSRTSSARCSTRSSTGSRRTRRPTGSGPGVPPSPPPARTPGRQVVRCFDLESFFASVRAGRVYGVFRLAGYPEPVAHTLAALCTTVTPTAVLRDAPPVADQRRRPAPPDAVRRWRTAPGSGGAHLPRPRQPRRLPARPPAGRTRGKPRRRLHPVRR